MALDRFLPIPSALRRSPVELSLAVAILLVGIAVRFAVIMVYDAPARHDFSDMAGYIEGARQIAAHHFLKGHFFQGVGYPLLLAALGVGHNAWTALSIVHFLTSVGTLVLAWRCAARLAGERTALFAAALLALDIPLVGIAAFAMPETVYTFCVTAALWLWLERDREEHDGWFLGLGVAMALGFVLKGTVVVLVPLLAVYMLAACKRRLRAGALFLAGFGVVILPLMLWVHHAYGHYKVGADNGGFSFMDGHCPSKINLNTDGTGWMSPLNAQLGEAQTRTWSVPFDDSGYYFRAGLQCIKEDPVEVARSVRYVYYLFFDNDIWPVDVGPLATPSRVASMIWRTAVFPGLLFGAIALAFKRRRQDWIWLGFVLAPVVVAYVFKGEARYRLPFDPVFIALSAFGWKTALSGLSAGLRGIGLAEAGGTVATFRRWEPRGRQDRLALSSAKQRGTARRISTAA